MRETRRTPRTNADGHRAVHELAVALVTAESLNNLALLHLDLAEPEEAARLLERALDIRRTTLSEAHPLTLQTLCNLAVPTWHLGRPDEAIGLLEDAVDGFRELRPTSPRR